MWQRILCLLSERNVVSIWFSRSWTAVFRRVLWGLLRATKGTITGVLLTESLEAPSKVLHTSLRRSILSTEIGSQVELMR